MLRENRIKRIETTIFGVGPLLEMDLIWNIKNLSYSISIKGRITKKGLRIKMLIRVPSLITIMGTNLSMVTTRHIKKSVPIFGRVRSGLHAQKDGMYVSKMGIW